jgi:phosphoglucomutase
MYQEEYKRWLAADLEDADLNPELSRIEGNDEEIKDRFAVALKFGTAGLRGVLGAGTNRMNIYVVRQATQGLANWVKTQGGNQTVAISYDSRLKSDVFAKNAAGVLAANGIKVRIYDALMPVPALSFATRYYECNAGIMVTASHNPAKYNGYKAYGPDGCQMTDDAAAIVYDEIQKTDVLTGAKYMSFAEGVEEGLIRFVGDDCKQALYEAIESRQVRPGLQSIKRFRSCTCNSGIKRYRNHRHHYRSGTGISERILHNLQLSEPGDLCSSGTGIKSCKRNRCRLNACN